MKEKTYTIDSFRSTGDDPIITTGQFTNDGLNINESDILSELIVATGRLCERYASDLFIDWQTVVRDLKSRTRLTPATEYLFGLRECGVDHTEWILAKINDSPTYGAMEYRRIYKLRIETAEPYGYPSPMMTLTRVWAY